MKESKNHFSASPSGGAQPEGERALTGEELNLSGHVLEHTPPFFFNAPTPINKETNLSLVQAGLPICVNFLTRSSVFEWSPDKANSQCSCGFWGSPIWNRRH